MHVEYDETLDLATAYGYPDAESARDALSDALGCGPDAPAALDQIDDTTWWAYCEPALADSPTQGVGEAHYVEASTSLPDSLAVTGAADVSPLTVVVGVALIVAGLITMRLRRRVA